MSRILNIAGAQLGPIGRNESRKTVVSRMCELLKQAKDKNCDLVVFPEGMSCTWEVHKAVKKHYRFGN